MSILSTVLTVAQQVNPESEFRSFMSTGIGSLIVNLLRFAAFGVLIYGGVKAVFAVLGRGGGRNGAVRGLILALVAAAFMIVPALFATMVGWVVVLIQALFESVGDVFSRA